MKRKDYALAYLSFIEEIEDQDNTKRKGKHNHERKQKLYRITSQLLEARGMSVQSYNLNVLATSMLIH